MYTISLTKIKYIPFLLPLLLVTNLFAQKTDLQRDNLKGKVKSVSFYTDSKLVKTRTYNLNGFETDVKNYCVDNNLSVCSYHTSMFDPKGNMVKYEDDYYIIEKNYDDANNLIESEQLNKVSKKIFEKLNYSYVNFRKIRSEQTKYSFNSDVIEFTIIIDYSYDSNGNLVEEDNAYTSHSITTKKKTIYKYDESQNLIEKTENNNDGRMQYNYTYKYDPAKRKVEYKARSFNGSNYTNYNEYFKYDEKGHMVESSHYELTGKLLYKDVYNFDNAGNQIKRSHYYGDVLTTETVDIFSDQGLLTDESEYKSKALILKKTFKYDATGNIIGALHTDTSGAIKTTLDYKISYY
jgi:hypothetical protein